jgi:hypothetical protein
MRVSNYICRVPQLAGHTIVISRIHTCLRYCEALDLSLDCCLLLLLLLRCQAPDADGLERFLGRLPLVMNVVIMSPHGYFGQSNVLGLPDTGGQVRRHAGRVAGYLA